VPHCTPQTDERRRQARRRRRDMPANPLEQSTVLSMHGAYEILDNLASVAAAWRRPVCWLTAFIDGTRTRTIGRSTCRCHAALLCLSITLARKMNIRNALVKTRRRVLPVACGYRSAHALAGSLPQHPNGGGCCGRAAAVRTILGMSTSL